MGGMEALTTGKMQRGNGMVSKSPYRQARTVSLKSSRELEETNQKTHCLGVTEDARIGMFGFMPVNFDPTLSSQVCGCF